MDALACNACKRSLAQPGNRPAGDRDRKACRAYIYIYIYMPTEEFLDRFSKLDRALRVLAYVHRFVHRCRSPLSGVCLEAQDVAAAERLITICTQRSFSSKEYRCLSQKRPVPAASSILSLNPFLDKKGLIRACDRVTASDYNPTVRMCTLAASGKIHASHFITWW